MISKKNLSSEELKKKFVKDLKILEALSHPNILKVYDFYQDNKRYYLVTEYIDGGELLDKVIKEYYIQE